MIYNGLRSVERRKNPRRDLEVPLIVYPLNFPCLISGRIQNISLGGMRVKSKVPPSPLEQDEQVRFYINKEGLVLEGEGKVVWTSETEGEAGIKFTRLLDETRDSLEKFLGLVT